MQISLGLKKYSLLLGMLFGGQQMQGMEMALQVTSTIVDGVLTIAQSAPFLAGVMPDAFNNYVLNCPIVPESVGKVSKSLFSFKDTTFGIFQALKSDEKAKFIRFGAISFMRKCMQSKIATVFYLARILGVGCGLWQIIRKDDDKMMGKKGLRITAGLLIEIKLLNELLK